MTRDSRAVSTTSRVTVLRWLISRIRVICAKRRWTSRKLPLVMRATAGDGFDVGEVLRGEGEPELFPVVGEDESELVEAEGAVLVGEADAAVELRVAREATFETGHADQDQPDVVAVEEVAELCEARGFQSVGFVDD
jgi:hypothetical protein